MPDDNVERPEDEQAEEYGKGQDDLTEVGDEVPEADALEQHEPVTDAPDASPVDVEREANEADLLEQAEPVDNDEDAWE